MEKQKSDKEWEAINFRNGLGPQIGGLMKQAVELTIAFGDTQNNDGPVANIKYWLDVLYKLAEQKKQSILEAQPKDDSKEEVIPF